MIAIQLMLPVEIFTFFGGTNKRSEGSLVSIESGSSDKKTTGRIQLGSALSNAGDTGVTRIYSGSSLSKIVVMLF